MKHFEELESFINNHEDWKELLEKEPYNLFRIKQCPWNPDWYRLTYNLLNSNFSIPLVKQCRGTVVEYDNETKKCKIVCAPMTKFFNYGQSECDSIDWTSAKVTEKLDGQLIKMFKYNDEDYWISNDGWSIVDLFLATPYFSSEDKCNPFEQLKLAFGFDFVQEDNGRVHVKDPDGTWVEDIPNGYCIMFEMTGPYNRIICNYPETKAYLIACRKSDGSESDPSKIKLIYHIKNFIPKVYNLHNLVDVQNYLKTFDGHEHEGFVIVDNQFNRVKMKADDYLRLRHILGENGLSKTDLFMSVVNKDFDDIIGNFPEYQKDIDFMISTYNQLLKDWSNVKTKLLNMMETLGSRKALADKLKDINCLKTGFLLLKYNDFNDFIKSIQCKKKLYIENIEPLVNDLKQLVILE